MQMEIKYQGFLSYDIIHKYSMFYDLPEYKNANELNKYCYEIYNDMKYQFEDINFQDILIGYYILMHKTYQSAVILFSQGLVDDALALTRVVFEKLVYIQCILKDEIYLDMISVNELHKRIKDLKLTKNGMIKLVSKSNSDVDVEISEIKTIIENLFKKINAKLNKNYTGDTKFSFKYFVDTLNSFENNKEYEYMYRVMYNSLSKRIHPSVSLISNNFIADNNIKFSFDKDFLDVGEYLNTLIYFMANATNSMYEYFKIENKEFEKFYKG